MKDLDNWQPYRGEYPKAFCDIILKDGRLYNQVWPNAGQFHVNGDVIDGALVAQFRRSESQYPLPTPRKSLFGPRRAKRR